MFDITSNAKVVIVVEKDATFQRLMQEDFLGFVDFDVLLITGKGVPDLSTRKLLYRLANQDLENALFLCLVDGDPYGVAIMLIYKVTLDTNLGLKKRHMYTYLDTKVRYVIKASVLVLIFLIDRLIIFLY